MKDLSLFYPDWVGPNRIAFIVWPCSFLMLWLLITSFNRMHCNWIRFVYCVIIIIIIVTSSAACAVGNIQQKACVVSRWSLALALSLSHSLTLGVRFNQNAHDREKLIGNGNWQQFFDFDHLEQILTYANHLHRFCSHCNGKTSAIFTFYFHLQCFSSLNRSKRRRYELFCAHWMHTSRGPSTAISFARQYNF